MNRRVPANLPSCATLECKALSLEPGARQLLSLSPRERSLPVISARNQLDGTIKSVKLGTVMAEIVATVGPFELVSAITRASAEAMKLKAGDRVKIVIKATEVMVAKD